MIGSTIFIVAVIAGITQFIKLIRDRNYAGALLIVTAALVGALVGVFDTSIGVEDISVAQGLMAGLAAAGTVATAERIG